MDQLYLQYLSGHIIIDYILLSQPPTSAAPTHSHISLEFDSVANASIHTIFLIHLCPTYIFVHLLYRSFVYIAICIFIRLGSVKLRVLYSGSPAFDTLRPLGLGCRDLKFKSVKLCCWHVSSRGKYREECRTLNDMILWSKFAYKRGDLIWKGFKNRISITHKPGCKLQTHRNLSIVVCALNHGLWKMEPVNIPLLFGCLSGLLGFMLAHNGDTNFNGIPTFPPTWRPPR